MGAWVSIKGRRVYIENATPRPARAKQAVGGPAAPPPAVPVGSHNLHEPAVVVDAVRRAVAERPERATHGNTGTNAFIHTPAGRIVPYNEYAGGWQGSGGHLVHSHGAENWTEGRQEDFQPHNYDDVALFQKSFKKGDLTGSTVIMPDGRMETLAAAPDASLEQRRVFLALGPAKIKKELGSSYDEAAAAYRERGIKRHEYDREKLVGFAAKYGLSYRHDLRWK